jgi:adenine specific DNA methylase Mod
MICWYCSRDGKIPNKPNGQLWSILCPKCRELWKKFFVERDPNHGDPKLIYWSGNAKFYNEFWEKVFEEFKKKPRRVKVMLI